MLWSHDSAFLILSFNFLVWNCTSLYFYFTCTVNLYFLIVRLSILVYRDGVAWIHLFSNHHFRFNLLLLPYHAWPRKMSIWSKRRVVHPACIGESKWGRDCSKYNVVLATIKVTRKTHIMFTFSIKSKLITPLKNDIL